MNTPRSPGLPFIFVTLLIDMIGLGVVIPVGPQLVTQLTGNPLLAARNLGLLIASFSLMQLLAAPVLGTLSDRFGRRPVLLVSTLLTAASYGLAALASSLAWLFLARALGGIGGATIGVANAYIADVSTPQTRARNFGLAGAAFGLGLIVGPALGGLLGQYGLRLPYVVAAALAVLNFLYGLVVLPESRQRNDEPIALSSFVPLRALGVLSRFPGLPVLAAVIICMNLAQQFLTSTWVLHGTVRYGWTTGVNGLSLAVAGVVSAFVQIALLPRILGRLGNGRTVTLGIVLGVLGYVFYGLSSSPWMVFAAMPVGALAGVAAPALQALITGQTPPQAQGAVQGALGGAGSLCAIAGPLLSTALFSHFAASDAPIHLPGVAFFAGALCLLAGLAVFLAFRPQPISQGEPV
ncbi:MFS transporter [Deinococcus altitudinis]|uniref:MFS transporter n=1 Tax=Deinococcus altitudinis TaxID=468914 RepID=UPI0038912A47